LLAELIAVGYMSRSSLLPSRCRFPCHYRSSKTFGEEMTLKILKSILVVQVFGRLVSKYCDTVLAQHLNTRYYSKY
jgi:hypothetical protein